MSIVLIVFPPYVDINENYNFDLSYEQSIKCRNEGRKLFYVNIVKTNQDNSMAKQKKNK